MLVKVKDIALTYDESQDPLGHSQRPISLELKASRDMSCCVRSGEVRKSPGAWQCDGLLGGQSRMCIANIR